MKSDCFYYGTYTPEGFYSLAQKQEFSTDKNLTVNSYSLSLKQRLFSEIKTELEKKGYNYIDFRSDDKSLGIYSKDAGIRIADGTYYDADEDVIFLGNALTESAQRCIDRRENEVRRTQRFLSACRYISNDMIRIDSENIDMMKINRFAARLWSATGGTLKGSVGTEHKRFVTCFTPDGVELNLDAFDIYCDNVTVICEKSGACAARIVDRVRRYALSAGYDVISCLCPMNVSRGPEHLIIPELKYGIFVCKHYHKGDFKRSRRVFYGRFLSSSSEQTRHRMDFSMKAYRRLMQEVFFSLEEIKKCDNELESLADNEFAEEQIGNILQLLFGS